MFVGIITMEIDFETSDIQDDKVIDEIYDNAIKHLEATVKSKEETKKRTYMLLTYLLLIFGFCVQNILKFDNLYVSWSILGLYYMMLVIYVLFFQLHPSLVCVGYAEPEKLFCKKYIQYDISTFKVLRLIELQEEIIINKSETKRLVDAYQKTIMISIIPFILLLLFVVISFANWWFGHQYARFLIMYS
jgi:hypothetical protein